MTRRGPALVRGLMAALLFGAAPAHARNAPAAPPPRSYVVQAGDTFRGIAQRLGVEVEDLGAINGVPSPYVVRIGQVLRVPLPRRPEPVYASPPSREPAPAKVAAPTPRAPVQATPARKLAGAPRLAWPTDGAVATGFGQPIKGIPSNGMDLAAYKGMTVRAAAAGTVIFAGHEPERFGLLLVLDHGDGWASAYGYLGDLTVKEGQTVRAGERIARIGATGEARRPTLHFELRKDNVAVDPRPYLPARL